MTETEALIKVLHKEGKSARAIATELYERGLKNNAGKFMTPEMVEGFLRHGGIEVEPPAVFTGKNPLKAMKDAAYEDGEAGGRTSGDYGHLGPAIYERPFRACALCQWPAHTDFRPDELEVRD